MLRGLILNQFVLPMLMAPVMIAAGFPTLMAIAPLLHQPTATAQAVGCTIGLVVGCGGAAIAVSFTRRWIGPRHPLGYARQFWCVLIACTWLAGALFPLILLFV